MNAENRREEWVRLCEMASQEQDPEKLMVLVREITRLLEEREKAIKAKNAGPGNGFTVTEL